MAGVPHLNELNQKFRERGFEIVGVSDEDASTIAEMVKSKAAKYGIVKASKAAVYDAYGGDGYPSGWVLDAEGKCIWTGHPGNVKDDMVEGWIKDLVATRITKEVHKEIKGAVESFNKGELGKCEMACHKHEETTDAALKADVEYIFGLLEKRKDAAIKKADKLREAGQLVKLGELLEAEGKLWAGCDYGKTCSEDAKTLKASKEYKDCGKAEEALTKLKTKVNDMKADKAKKALEKIAKDYPNTPAGKEAAELAKDFE